MVGSLVEAKAEWLADLMAVRTVVQKVETKAGWWVGARVG